MNKISLIIGREYLTRVRKKSFILMSVLGPVLFAAFMIVPAWLATMEDTEVKTIAVADSSFIFTGNLPETQYIKFEYPENSTLEQLQKNLKNSHFNAILFIPKNILASNTSVLYSDKEPSLSTKMHIENAIEKEIEKQKLMANNIENLDAILKSVETSINLRSITLSEKGVQKESHTGLAMGIGYGSGMLIYFFIFLFGAQVMRGIIEEKSSRIIEVIISSVRPFQLMMGKIVGIGLVGLTQFILWMVLTFAFASGIQKFAFPEMTNKPSGNLISGDIMDSKSADAAEYKPAGSQSQVIEEIFNSLGDVDIVFILVTFLFFFLGGYLLYASLFAIIGSAVDNEADTQQFMFPVTVPLIVAILVMINVMNNPEGNIAFWFSLIPFTSPVVMMARIPFHPAAWEVLLSAFLLVVTFVATTWMAGKIYRTGILMYGKKVTYHELWKWLRYRN